MHYRLKGHTPVRCSMLEWGRWMQDADRHVGLTEIGSLQISTVFLGLDHNHGLDRREKRPVLFETMIFGIDEDDGYQTRCCTWEEAEAMHVRAVALATERVRAADAMIAASANKSIVDKSN